MFSYLSLCVSLSLHNGDIVAISMLKKDYTVLLIQLDGNLASDVSTRCSGRPQGNENWCRDSLIYRLYLRAWLLIIWRVIM